MKTLGFIGAGKMATALVRGVIDVGVATANETVVTDVHSEAAELLAQVTGAKAAATNAECAAAADVIFLCVKPGHGEAALAACADHLKGKLLVSILAGVSLDTLESWCGADVRIARVMPNTPVLVGAGASVIAVGERITADDTTTIEEIFSAVGTVDVVPESWMDAVTGLSGSGPAYVLMIIESLAEAGVHAGLPRNLARRLATQTVYGTGKLAIDTGEHPALLREAVTSPGGTTAAALAVLEAAAIRSAFIDAVQAAAERSEELSSYA